MAWSFEIEVRLVLSDQVMVGGTSIQLTIDPTRLSPGKITGKVEFECQNPPDIVADFGAAVGQSMRCCCKMFNFVEEGPDIVQELGVDAYVTGNNLMGALQVLPQLPAGVKVGIIPPKAELDSTMRLVATNDGRCYNVRIDCTLDFEPATLVLSLPSLPVAGALIPIPDQKYQIGSAVKSRYTSQYRICCCSWHTGYDQLLEFDPQSDTAEPVDEKFGIQSDDECLCGGFAAEHLKARKTGGDPTVKWLCKAEEGPCEWTVVSVGQSQLRKKRGGRRTEEHKT